MKKTQLIHYTPILLIIQSSYAGSGLLNQPDSAYIFAYTLSEKSGNTKLIVMVNTGDGSPVEVANVPLVTSASTDSKCFWAHHIWPEHQKCTDPNLLSSE